MSMSAEFDAWSAGKSYEDYMGRWSRRIAAKFVEWLAPRVMPPGSRSDAVRAR